ncbi:MAG: PspC domain-containing protein [Chloroflexota bacterium]
MDDRLYRSRDERILAGVAGGVAERLDADPSLIRIVWAVLVFLTGGLALLVYVVMAIVVPNAPDDAGVPISEPRPRSTAVDPAVAGPVPDGAWRAPDGSIVPLGARTPDDPPRRQDRPNRARSGVILGAVLIGLGALFLVRDSLPSLEFDAWWPVLSVVVGVVLVVAAVVPGQRPN